MQTREDIRTSFLKLAESINPELPKVQELMDETYLRNPWFTKENVTFCLQNWHEALSVEQIDLWLDEAVVASPSKNIGVVMAGNIPLVGLHDLLAIVATGNNAHIKLSSSDTILMQYAADVLNGSLNQPAITIVEQMKGMDAVIATGSNNSGRYFEYYFKDIPHIIRKNRTGIAVLSGNETTEELELLAKDVFRYFGLGCRNITKLFVPEDYNFTPMIDAFDEFKDVINHHKYANNYTYHKAIFLMNLDKHLDSGYLLLKEDEGLHAPLSCLLYEYYSNETDVSKKISDQITEIQVIESKLGINQAQPFGTSQRTGLFDYADKVNVIDFLNNL